MSLSLDNARHFSVADMVKLPARDLMQLQSEAAKNLQASKALKDWIEGVITLKYESQTQSLRTQMGKDTGMVHFDDDGIRVTADLPKKVEWNQHQLAELAQRIVANGDNPEQYLEITYKVAERKYTAWPEHLRSQFAPARTLKTGKPTFKLTATQETSHV